MLSTEIDSLIKNARKEHNLDLLNILQLIKTEFSNAIHSGKTLDEITETKILLKMAEQRANDAKVYEANGREDLANKEKIELHYLYKYTPKQPTDEDIENETRKVITTYSASNGPISMKNMKDILSLVKEKYPTANGKIVSKVVKSFINK